MSDRAPNATRPVEPLRQRLIRSLLYGRNVDRAAKARARVGLAILAFAAVYAIIAGRLVQLAVTPDAEAKARTRRRLARRTAGRTSSTATARCWPPTSRSPRSSPSRAS